MRTKYIKASLLVGLSAALPLLTSACSFGPHTPECRAFAGHTVERQREVFAREPVERQLDLYLCKMRQHPGDSSYARPIADRGPEAIPAVLAKMRGSDDADKARLLHIIEVMSYGGHLRRRVDVYAELSKMVDGMHPVRRRTCEEKLKRIAVNSGIKQFTYTSSSGIACPERGS